MTTLTDTTVSALTADGTYTTTGHDVTYPHGYSVGGVVPTIIVPAGDLLALVRAFARQAAVAETTGAHVGVWTHDGSVHVDVSQYVPGRIDAMRLAFRRGEHSVWDWRRMASFRVLGSTVVS